MPSHTFKRGDRVRVVAYGGTHNLAESFTEREGVVVVPPTPGNYVIVDGPTSGAGDRVTLFNTNELVKLDPRPKALGGSESPVAHVVAWFCAPATGPAVTPPPPGEAGVWRSTIVFATSPDDAIRVPRWTRPARALVLNTTTNVVTEFDIDPTTRITQR